MASFFESIRVLAEDASGVLVDGGSGVEVRIRIEGESTDLFESPFTTDAAGIVESAELPCEPGTKVYFRIENHDGLAGSIALITTA